MIIVAALRGASDAALYTAATRFLVVGQTAANALSVAVQHRFGALLSVGRTADANRLYQLTTTWLILMIWPFYLTWAVFAGRLMAIFGGGYASAKTVGIVLALTMLVATACGMVSMVLEMAGNTGVTLLQTGAALVIDIVLDILLVPHLGPLGAAIGWAGALLFNNLVPLATLYRRYRLYPISRAGATAMIVAARLFRRSADARPGDVRRPSGRRRDRFRDRPRRVCRGRLAATRGTRSGRAAHDRPARASKVTGVRVGARDGDNRSTRPPVMPRRPRLRRRAAVVVAFADSRARARGLRSAFAAAFRVTVPARTPVPAPTLTGTLAPGTAGPFETTGRGPVPPTSGAWFGVYAAPNNHTAAEKIKAVNTFQTVVGRKVAIVHSFHPWSDVVPSDIDSRIIQNGQIDLLSWAGTDTLSIASGAYDNLIEHTAVAIKNLGAPILLRFRWEMDRPNLGQYGAFAGGVHRRVEACPRDLHPGGSDQRRVRLVPARDRVRERDGAAVLPG